MTCVHFLIILPSTPPSLQLVPVKTKHGGVGEPGISAALVSLFLSLMAWFSQIPQQIYVNAHPLACGCRYEWWQPVRADGPNDVLTAINMAKKKTLIGMSPQLQEPGQIRYNGLWCITQPGVLLSLRRQHCWTWSITQISAVSVPSLSTSSLSTGIPLIAWVLFSLTCMNKMKQSRGININAVITALRATQNQDNSRRLASRKKKKILITLASAFFTNGRHAAACHFCSENVQTYLCFCSFLLWPVRLKEGAKILLNYVFVRDVMKFIFFIMCFMSRGAPVWKFSSSPGIQAAVFNSRAKLLLSGMGLNRGHGKFGLQCWCIFTGMRMFLGTTRHLLVFQVSGTVSVGEVQ